MIRRILKWVEGAASDARDWEYLNRQLDNSRDLIQLYASKMKRQEARSQELLESNTRLAEELRVTDRECMVREFHTVVLERRIPDRPEVPAEKDVRLWAKMLLEETIEVVEASFAESKIEPWHIERLKSEAAWVVESCPVRVRFPELIDGTIDVDYISEGFRQVCGVKSAPVWLAVQKANLAKRDGPRRADNKILKPAGWMPPDIEGELKKQGWVEARTEGIESVSG